MNVYFSREQVNLLNWAATERLLEYKDAMVTGLSQGEPLNDSQRHVFPYRIVQLKICIDKLEKADSKF